MKGRTLAGDKNDLEVLHSNTQDFISKKASVENIINTK